MKIPSLGLFICLISSPSPPPSGWPVTASASAVFSVAVGRIPLYPRHILMKLSIPVLNYCGLASTPTLTEVPTLQHLPKGEGLSAKCPPRRTLLYISFRYRVPLRHLMHRHAPPRTVTHFLTTLTKNCTALWIIYPPLPFISGVILLLWLLGLLALSYLIAHVGCSDPGRYRTYNPVCPGPELVVAQEESIKTQEYFPCPCACTCFPSSHHPPLHQDDRGWHPAHSKCDA